MESLSNQLQIEAVLQGKDLHAIFRVWEEQYSTSNFNPVTILTRLSEIFEEETEAYMRKDPDPFDERHPSRTDPDCELGRSLKLLFRKDHFMTRLVNDYLRENFFTRQNIQKSSLEVNIAACRLILVIMPGLETSAVFQTELDSLVIINRLYSWAENSEEPLQSYATGLLAAAMEVPDIAVGFREQNTRLVTVMLKRLHTLQLLSRQAKLNIATNETLVQSSIARASSSDCSNAKDDPFLINDEQKQTTTSVSSRPFAHLGGGSAPSSPELKNRQLNGMAKFKNTINLSTLFQSDTSQGGDSIYVRNCIPIHPVTLETREMLILRYLTSMGEYQEFLGVVFEHNAIQLIFRYIENLEQRDTCLAFEALKYLASLLCHKKFSLEFIATNGLERLMKVPKPSIAATGVSIALYYLAYCEDAMERICTMPQKFISEVVSYALWLLGCVHDSGRCHATMFFGLSFQFKIILDEFDNQDGLRKMYNVISVLPILGIEEHNLNDDEECAARQLVRHVCVAVKKYMESHLYYKYTQVSRVNNPNNGPAQLTCRAPKSTPETISEQVSALQEFLPIRARWEPVEKILNLNGIPLLLRIIAYSYEWNYSGRAETVRSALDILIVCSVIPRVHLVFCERMELPDEATAAGINIILGAAEGEIVADAEVQKAALAVLVHCVCSPIYKPVSVGRYGSTKKKMYNKHSEELITNIWESVRSNNGIIVLLQLMEIKTPITDADYIRGMACRAMAGLARSETVRQIISKLPLFTNGQLQSLTRNPILQEKRTEHVQFQKYALELMERVSGKTKSENQLDASLANIHKANVVAQTKISFNEQQLYELIHEYFVARGLCESASILQKEAGLITKVAPIKPNLHHSPFSFRSPNNSLMTRVRMRSKQSDFTSMLNAAEPQTSHIKNDNEEHLNTTNSTNMPIKLIKKMHPTTPNVLPNNSQQRSLQKQISSVDNSNALNSWSTTNQINQHFSKNITLDTIITEYLTNQHALCKHPMATCPQFDLFTPHKCPDPRSNKISGHSLNFATRYDKRQAGFNYRKLERKLVHSHFCVARTLRPQDTDCYFTCCDFTPCASSIAVGSYNGEVKIYNINESGVEFSFNCHESYVNSIKCSRDGNLIVTSCSWRSPLSALWSIENRSFSLKLQWDSEEYLEFSNVAQDKILGTKAEVASIYDMHTGKKISSFVPTIFNQYTKNHATFCPSDELILSDGVLWDVRSGKELHKFDKLNQAISGVFHPNGLEVVSNTEVWDLRTFHLLRTVPALDQCQVIFSPQNVIYGMCQEPESRVEYSSGNCFESSFKTLDSYDYSSIVTVDVKRNIYDIAVNKYGSQIAIVENSGGYESLQESVVRIYCVGRKKNMEDEAEEEENEMEMSDDNSLSDNDSVVFRDRSENGNNHQRRRNRRNRRINNESDDDTEWIPVNSSDSSSSSSSSASSTIENLLMNALSGNNDGNNDGNIDGNNDGGGNSDDNGNNDNESLRNNSNENANANNDETNVVDNEMAIEQNYNENSSVNDLELNYSIEVDEEDNGVDNESSSWITDSDSGND